MAAVVGFWAQDNEILVSQMQSCRGTRLPGKDFGVTCLSILEVVGREMGFDKVTSYTAERHPIFREHPGSWKQLNQEFRQIWDSSARKLNYEPTNGRKGMYVKHL